MKRYIFSTLFFAVFFSTAVWGDPGIDRVTPPTIGDELTFTSMSVNEKIHLFNSTVQANTGRFREVWASTIRGNSPIRFPGETIFGGTQTANARITGSTITASRVLLSNGAGSPPEQSMIDISTGDTTLFKVTSTGTFVDTDIYLRGTRLSATGGGGGFANPATEELDMTGYGVSGSTEYGFAIVNGVASTMSATEFGIGISTNLGLQGHAIYGVGPALNIGGGRKYASIGSIADQRDGISLELDGDTIIQEDGMTIIEFNNGEISAKENFNVDSDHALGTDGTWAFNKNGADIDGYIESDDIPNSFYMNAGDNVVQHGTNTITKAHESVRAYVDGGLQIGGDHSAIYVGNSTAGVASGLPAAVAEMAIIVSTHVGHTDVTELFVMDSGGNYTQITDHAYEAPTFKNIPDSVSRRIQKSGNVFAGFDERIDLTGMALYLQKKALIDGWLEPGQEFVHVQTFTPPYTWDDVQEKHKQKKDKQIADWDEQYADWLALPEEVRGEWSGGGRPTVYTKKNEPQRLIDTRTKAQE